MIFENLPLVASYEARRAERERINHEFRRAIQDTLDTHELMQELAERLRRDAQDAD